METIKRHEQARAIETKRKLIDVGQQYIRSGSFSKVVVEDITNASGVSKGTFYHYFKSKDEFFFRIISEPFGTMNNNLAISQLPFGEALFEYLQEGRKAMSSRNVENLAYWLGHTSDEAYLRVHQELFGEGRDYATDCEQALLALFKRAVENGEIPSNAPINVAAELLVSALLGTTVRFCLSQGSYKTDIWVENAYRMTLLILNAGSDESLMPSSPSFS